MGQLEIKESVGWMGNRVNQAQLAVRVSLGRKESREMLVFLETLVSLGLLVILGN